MARSLRNTTEPNYRLVLLDSFDQFKPLACIDCELLSLECDVCRVTCVALCDARVVLVISRLFWISWISIRAVYLWLLPLSSTELIASKMQSKFLQFVVIGCVVLASCCVIEANPPTRHAPNNFGQTTQHRYEQESFDQLADDENQDNDDETFVQNTERSYVPRVASSTDTEQGAELEQPHSDASTDNMTFAKRSIFTQQISNNDATLMPAISADFRAQESVASLPSPAQQATNKTLQQQQQSSDEGEADELLGGNIFDTSDKLAANISPTNFEAWPAMTQEPTAASLASQQTTTSTSAPDSSSEFVVLNATTIEQISATNQTRQPPKSSTTLARDLTAASVKLALAESNKASNSSHLHQQQPQIKVASFSSYNWPHHAAQLAAAGSRKFQPKPTSTTTSASASTATATGTSTTTAAPSTSTGATSVDWRLKLSSLRDKLQHTQPQPALSNFELPLQDASRNHLQAAPEVMQLLLGKLQQPNSGELGAALELVNNSTSSAKLARPLGQQKLQQQLQHSHGSEILKQVTSAIKFETEEDKRNKVAAPESNKPVAKTITTQKPLDLRTKMSEQRDKSNWNPVLGVDSKRTKFRGQLNASPQQHLVDVTKQQHQQQQWTFDASPASYLTSDELADAIQNKSPAVVDEDDEFVDEEPGDDDVSGTSQQKYQDSSVTSLNDLDSPLDYKQQTQHLPTDSHTKSNLWSASKQRFKQAQSNAKFVDKLQSFSPLASTQKPANIDNDLDSSKGVASGESVKTHNDGVQNKAPAVVAQPQRFAVDKAGTRPLVGREPSFEYKVLRNNNKNINRKKIIAHQSRYPPPRRPLLPLAAFGPLVFNSADERQQQALRNNQHRRRHEHLHNSLQAHRAYGKTPVPQFFESNNWPPQAHHFDTAASYLSSEFGDAGLMPSSSSVGLLRNWQPVNAYQQLALANRQILRNVRPFLRNRQPARRPSSSLLVERLHRSPHLSYPACL